MSDATGLQDRLARLRRLGLRRGIADLQPKREAQAKKKRGPGIEEMVTGQVCETRLGACFVADERWSLSHCHGDLPLSAALAVSPTTLARLADLPASSTFDFRLAAFIDVETSGLSGGTGTYAFLVGVGFFEDDAFRVQQFFMRDVTEEPAMLCLVGEMLDRFDAVVSFNGRAFDLPLLNTRFILARQPRRLTRAPHLDLLKPSRRLWRRRLESCSLGSLEREVLGVHRSEEDVPGWLVPRLYFDYIQTGDASELAGVFYHNLVDVLSMVTLAARLGAVFDDPQFIGQLDGVDLFSLGRWYERLDIIEEGEAAYRSALSNKLLPPEVQQAAWRHLSFLLKRQGQREEAADIWRKVAENGGSGGVYACVELAKHYEWHIGDLPAAAAVTRQAMVLLENTSPSRRTQETLAGLAHRLRRLERKMARQSREVVP
jgi:uncharacterized protein YprB with RNaseH-like and TPR domain